MQGVSLKPYLIVPPEYFCYVSVTSRNGNKISIAYNDSYETYIVSSSYITFEVTNKTNVLPKYLFLFFNRPEFDRIARFNSWGSAREVFSWEDFCDIEIELPTIEVQQKYVDIYNAMVANQKAYETSLEDFRVACEAFLDKLKLTANYVLLKDYISLSTERNTNNRLGINFVRGVSIEKKFIETKANMNGVSLSSYAVVHPHSFSMVTVTSRNSDKVSLALNTSNMDYICSSTYLVFNCDETKLSSDYLNLYFNRAEFDRYARFNSWGSAREVFSWEDLQNTTIPLPPIKVQKALAELFNVYIERKVINEALKTQIKDICPILIRGSLKEGA